MLARLSDPRAVEGLTKALRNPDSRFERHAALALGQIGDPAAPRWLVFSSTATTRAFVTRQRPLSVCCTIGAGSSADKLVPV
jgi:HEAT repeat protein